MIVWHKRPSTNGLYVVRCLRQMDKHLPYGYIDRVASQVSLPS
jgi:hypothetical protein